MKTRILTIFLLILTGNIFAQKVGINTDSPTVELDVRPISGSGDAEINLGSFDNSTFLQLYSNLKTDQNPGLWWLPGKMLKFHLGDPAMLSNTEFFRLDGRTIGIYNTGRSIYIGTGAGALDDFNSRANIGIGAGALKNNTLSKDLVAVGDSSLTMNSQASNTAIGSKAMRFNTIGKWNTALGDHTLYRNVDGNANVAIGQTALYRNTDRSGLVAIGDSSLYNNGLNVTLPAHATGNVGVGSRSLRYNTLGWSNTAVGSAAMLFNTEGNNNTAIGRESLTSNTTGQLNTAVGRSALLSNIDGNDNTAFGTDALKDNTGGNRNVAIGTSAAHENTTGDENIAIGRSALWNNTAGSKNVAIGNEALSQITDRTGMVAIGDSALHSNSIGYDNVAVGYHSLKSNTEGQSNVAVGRNSLLLNQTGDDNTAIGRSSLLTNIDGLSNTAVGRNSLLNNISGDDNTAIGRSALVTHSSGHSNTAVGRNAMLDHESGSNNTAIGRSALFNNISGSGNIAIGYSAGLNEYGSDKLYIDNNSTSTPLIYGDFLTNLLRTNGKHEVTDDFIVTNSAFFVDQSLRRAGIGTINPEVELHVYDPGFTYVKVESGVGNDAIIQLTDNPTGTADSSWTIRNDGSMGHRFQLRYNNASKLVLTQGGNMALGTTVPATGYRLSVDGKIIAEELRIQVNGSWPDYVFEDEYELMPLEMLDQSIKENGHLPGMPKAEVIEAEGFDTGEMQRKMMEKIEELTLYVIDLKKENDELRTKVDAIYYSPGN